MPGGEDAAGGGLGSSALLDSGLLQVPVPKSPLGLVRAGSFRSVTSRRGGGFVAPSPMSRGLSAMQQQSAGSVVLDDAGGLGTKIEMLRVANEETELLQIAVDQMAQQQQLLADENQSDSESSVRSNQVSLDGLSGALPGALQHRALYFLSGDNSVRLFLYWLTHRREFEAMVILVIMANSAFLALDDPTTGGQEDYLQYADIVFTALFTLELCVKVLASGLCMHPHSYLRSGWNVLDFLIVILAYCALLPGVGNYSAVRVLRVLRPLRSINGIPGLKDIVNALFQSVLELFHVLMLVLFFFLVFGILGVQLFMGLYRMRCVEESTGVPPPGVDERFCTDYSSPFLGRQCPDHLVCRKYENPDHGYVSFDHIGVAFLVVFQCITLEGWVDQMYRVQDLRGQLAPLYFVPLVVLGSYFILNLALAVISERFHSVKHHSQTQELRRLAQEELEWAREQLGAMREANEQLVAECKSEAESADAAAREDAFCADELTRDDTVGTLQQLGRSGAVSTHCTRPDDIPQLASSPSRFHSFRLAVLKATTHRVFQRSVFFFIIVNTVLLAIEHHGQPRKLTEFLSIANFLLTGVFTAEMLLKLFAMGVQQYVHDSFNILDACVVFVSLVELGLSGSSSVSVFRALRLFRVFKLMKDFTTLRDIIRAIVLAVRETGYLNLIILLYLLIAALVGMQLFGGKFGSDAGEGGQEVEPRATFDSFYWSLLTVFQVLTREDWHKPMWSAMRATHPFAALYFVTLVILGDFLILNLFLAILITSFDQHMPGSAKEFGDELRAEEDMLAQATRALVDTESVPSREAVQRGSLRMSIDSGGFSRQSRDDFFGSRFAELVARGPHPSISSVPSAPSLLGGRSYSTAEADGARVYTKAASGGRSSTVSAHEVHEAAAAAQAPSGPCQCWLASRGYSCDFMPHVGRASLGGATLSLLHDAKQWQLKLPDTNGGHSLGMLGPNNLFRVWLTYIVTHRFFERTILLFILVSSLLLAVEDPGGDPHPALFALNIAFTVIFICEMVLKVLAFGLVLGKGAYLSDGWNVLDAFVVGVSVLSLVFSSFSIVKVFRALRALRPLRVVNRNLGLKLVVRTLLKALPGVANVALIASLIFLVFGILGVQLFAGRMHKCTDPSITHKADCSGADPNHYQVGSNSTPVQRQWVRNDQCFDNLLLALLTLFEVATLELWVDIMYRTIDAKAVDQGPERDSNRFAGIYFMVFVVIGSFFVMNLFVGVVIHNYNIEKRLVEGLNLLSTEQVKWIEMQQLMLTFRPKVKMLDGSERFIVNKHNDQRVRLSRRRRALASMASSRTMEALVMVVIMVNIVIMAIDHEGISDDLDSSLTWVNHCCSVFFILEAIIKLSAWRLMYFRDSWNVFDFMLVVLAAFGLSVAAASQSSPGGADPTVLRLFRIFRVFRIVRLVRSSRGIRVLLETLWYSLPYLSNIGLFLGLIFFIYATLGINLFNGVRHGEYLNEHANFDNFGVTLLLLVRVCTGETWNGIMHDLMNQPANCSAQNDCPPSPFIPPLYFITFLIIAAQVMLNLFVAIILDTFSTTLDIEQSSVKMSDLNRFVSCWSEFNDDGSMLLPTHRFPALLVRLGLPLGFEKEYTRLEVLLTTGKYRVPEHGGVVHFVEVLIPLARASMGVELQENDIREQELAWRNHFPDLAALPTLYHRSVRVTIDQFFAASYIAAAYRRSAAIQVARARREERWVQKKRWHALTSSVEVQTTDILPQLLDALRTLALQQDPSLGRLCSVLGLSDDGVSEKHPAPTPLQLAEAAARKDPAGGQSRRRSVVPAAPLYGLPPLPRPELVLPSREAEARRGSGGPESLLGAVSILPVDTPTFAPESSCDSAVLQRGSLPRTDPADDVRSRAAATSLPPEADW
eukprot:TRINITY_DN22979_c0_g1_i1.p1 TRINITY_DN22979_c0_g1~~TRINITY_DN22979_c0_g1_i1.p1  ORF type:complete len:1900 (+),score=689.80 TRINITY_DN22979_c0_g1_i1:56-5701(+)